MFKSNPSKGNFVHMDLHDEELLLAPKTTAQPSSGVSGFKVAMLVGGLIGSAIMFGAMHLSNSNAPELFQQQAPGQFLQLEVLSDTDEFCPDGAVNPCYRNTCKNQGDVMAACTRTQDETDYLCRCSEHFSFHEDSHACVRDDACVGSPCGEHSCKTTGPGNYVCICNEFFYNENPTTCLKIDGCELGGSEACGVHNGWGSCVANKDTSYKCECNKGYVEDEGKCIERNPCECEEDKAGTGCLSGVHGSCVDEAPGAEVDDASEGYHCS